MSKQITGEQTETLYGPEPEYDELGNIVTTEVPNLSAYLKGLAEYSLDKAMTVCLEWATDRAAKLKAEVAVHKRALRPSDAAGLHRYKVMWSEEEFARQVKERGDYWLRKARKAEQEVTKCESPNSP